VNRGIRSFAAPSRRDWVKYSKALEQRVAALEQALKHVVKSEGSSLVEGRYVITIPDNDENLPKPYEVLTIKRDDAEKVTRLVLEIPEELKEQIRAFQAEQNAKVVLTDAPAEA
jgi:hypothetical protein